jgi:hypothetical protein
MGTGAFWLFVCSVASWISQAAFRFAFGAGTLTAAANFTRANAFGTLTLTVTGPLDTQTVTIDGKVYTFQTVLTNVNGNVLIGATNSDTLDNLIAAITLGAGAGTLYATATTLHATVTAAAGAGDTMVVTAKSPGTAGNSLATTETGTFTAWGAATLASGAAAETITIGTTAYRGVNFLAAANDILIGATASDSLDNLIAAVNAAAGEGTTYGTGTTVNLFASAAAGAGDTVTLTSLLRGVGGHYATTETAAQMSFGAAALTGGASEDVVAATAADGSMYVPAGVPITLNGTAGARLSVIRASGDGTASLTRVMVTE